MKVITGHLQNVTAQCPSCLEGALSPVEGTAAPALLSPTRVLPPVTSFSHRSGLSSACVSPTALPKQAYQSARDSQALSSSSSSAAPVALALFPELPENLHDTSKHLLKPLRAESLSAAERLSSSILSAEKAVVVPKGHVQEVVGRVNYGFHSGSSSPTSSSKAGSFPELREDAADFPAKKRQRVFKPVAVHGTAKLPSTLLDGVVPCHHPALRQFTDPPYAAQKPQYQQRPPQTASGWHAPFSPFASLPRKPQPNMASSLHQSTATVSFVTAAATVGTDPSLAQLPAPPGPPSSSSATNPSSPRPSLPVLPCPPLPADRPECPNLVPDAVARLQRVLATWHTKLGFHNSHVVGFAFHIFTRVLHRLSLGMVAAEDLRVSLAVCLWIAARAAGEAGDRWVAEESKSPVVEAGKRKRGGSPGHRAEDKAGLTVEELSAVTRVPVQQLLEGEEVIGELLARSGVAMAADGGMGEGAAPMHHVSGTAMVA